MGVRRIIVGSRVQYFLSTQHSLSLKSKDGYRWAVQNFNFAGGCLFEEQYLNTVLVHGVLADLQTVMEPSSWNTLLIFYQRLAKWLSDPDDEVCPKLWRDIDRQRVDWDEKLKDKWLSEAEIYKILDVCDVARDRAIFAVYLAGLRAAEGLGVKLRDVKPYGNGNFEILVSGKGKTTRPVYVSSKFAPPLRYWLNVHPLKHNPAAALFVTYHYTVPRPLGYRGLWRVVDKWCRRARLDRHISPHFFRHTRATWTAQNRKIRASGEVVNKMMGWSKGSKMYSRYTHITGADVSETALALDGVETAVKAAEAPSCLAPRRCLRCQEDNAAGTLYCSKCGLILDEEQAQAELRKQKAMDLFLKLMERDPDYMRKLDEKG